MNKIFQKNKIKRFKEHFIHQPLKFVDDGRLWIKKEHKKEGKERSWFIRRVY